MFDIAGFWMAATMFCLPPILFCSLILLEVARAMVRKESNYELDLEVYHKVSRFFGTDVVGVIFISLLCSVPMMCVVFIYYVDRMAERFNVSFLAWLSHCCEFWAGVGAFVVTSGVVVFLLMMAVKGYVKLTLLAERVKKL